jgi:hypothetical protein
MSMKRYIMLSCFLVAGVVAAYGPAYAQEPPASPAPEASSMPPAPSETARPTLIDMQYDGRTHITAAPYVWLPNLGGSFQYQIPTLATRPHKIVESSISVPPSTYLPKLNSAAMFFTDVRKGPVDVFGDVIYVNASMSSATNATFAGPLGKVQIPLTLDTNAHVTTAIWEVAAGYTLARGHDADLSLFTGIRSFPLNLNLDYNATVGKRGIINPTGAINVSDYLSDLVVGMRGKVLFGDGHFFVPYYADYGTSINMVPQQTWQAYSGFGYAFNHGQTLDLLWRALNYNSFAPNVNTQRVTMAGALLGYTFQL